MFIGPYLRFIEGSRNSSLLSAFYTLNKEKFDEGAVEINNKVHTKLELFYDVIRISSALWGIGFDSEKILGIATPNLYEGVVLTFSANLLGGKVFYLDEKALELDLKRVEVDYLLVSNKSKKELTQLGKKLQKTITFIVVKGKDDRYFPRPNMLSFTELKEIGEYNEANFFNQDITYPKEKDLIFLQTSGSTSGVPKILPFKNESLYAFLKDVQASAGATANDRKEKKALIIVPYGIPYGWTMTFANLLIGNRVCFVEETTPEAIGKYYKLKPTYIYGTPLILNCFIEATPKFADLSSLERFYASGFSISEDAFKEGEKYLREHNCRGQLCNNYGVGEGLCVGTTSDDVSHKPNTSGKFYKLSEWVIVDEDMNEVGEGEVGEILLSSATLCNGYYNNPEETKASFISFRGKTFFKTGDFASKDSEGYVTIVGRKKRFYQPLGAKNKVNPETIEKALYEGGEVEKCGVAIYSPNEKYEASMAFVVLKDEKKSSKVTSDTLMNKLKTRLQDYQLPEKIIIIKELPLRSSGKIDYEQLESMCYLYQTKPL